MSQMDGHRVLGLCAKALHKKKFLHWHLSFFVLVQRGCLPRAESGPLPLDCRGPEESPTHQGEDYSSAAWLGTVRGCVLNDKAWVRVPSCVTRLMPPGFQLTPSQQSQHSLYRAPRSIQEGKTNCVSASTLKALQMDGIILKAQNI